jgi:hypothetical protein
MLTLEEKKLTYKIILQTNYIIKVVQPNLWYKKSSSIWTIWILITTIERSH